MTTAEQALEDALRRASAARDGGPSGLFAHAQALTLDAWLDFRASHPDEATRGRILRRRFAAELLLDEADRLSAGLTAAGVRHCFIKGAALTRRVYTPGERTFVDIDLLLHHDDLEAFLDATPPLGYHLTPEARAAAPPALRRGFDLEGPVLASLGPVRLDANWAATSVNRLLSDADTGALTAIWERLDTRGPLPVPADPDHLVLIVHHLVHHDLLHVRGLLDAIRLWERAAADGDARLEPLARRLHVLRVLQVLQDVLGRFGLRPLVETPAPAGRRTRALRRLMEPDAWVAWAARVPEREHLEVTPSRIRRRILALDRPWDILRLARDILVPPAPYLRWRWPQRRTLAGAWLAHVRRLVARHRS